jgi:hypothetical protein
MLTESGRPRLSWLLNWASSPDSKRSPVLAPDQVVDVALDQAGGVLFPTACALDTSDRVWCWQTGDNAQPIESPVRIEGLP